MVKKKERKERVNTKRQGRFTTEEEEFIRQNASVMHINDMATHLGRRPDSVINFVEKRLKDYKIHNSDVNLFDIKTRKYWPDIKKQLADDEIGLFEYHWNEIIKQFNKDVTHTEELQIVDVVRQEILSSRCLKSQQDNANTILRRQNELEVLKSMTERERDHDDQIFNLERQIAVLRAAQDTISKDFKTYQEQKMKLFDKIKGSRDQRVSKIEDNKESFATLVTKLRKDPKFSKDCSIQMEKMRLSMIKTLEKLGDYHKYADNMLDRPILNSDTVFYGEK